VIHRQRATQQESARRPIRISVHVDEEAAGWLEDDAC
jgi:hypothetical protein